MREERKTAVNAEGGSWRGMAMCMYMRERGRRKKNEGENVEKGKM